MRKDGEKLALAPIGLLQGGCNSHPLEKFRGLARVQINHPQRPLRGTMRVAEMRRQHAEQLTRAARDRRRLNCPETGRRRDLQVWGEVRVGLHILDNRPLPVLCGSPAHRTRISSRTAEVLEKVVRESSLRDDV